jgi:hypothetical protein
MDLVVRCPHCQAESRLGELVVVGTEQPLDAASLAETLGISAAEASAGLDVPTGLWGSIETISSSSLDFGQGKTDSTGTPAADWTRRQRSNKSVLGQAIGVVLGGLLALPIAYYALNLIRGEQFDWFSVPLPFAPHTYKHLPDWWPEWARPDSGDGARQVPRQAPHPPYELRQLILVTGGTRCARPTLQLSAERAQRVQFP